MIFAGTSYSLAYNGALLSVLLDSDARPVKVDVAAFDAIQVRAEVIAAVMNAPQAV